MKKIFVNDMIQKFQRSKFVKYSESEVIVDRTCHKSSLKKVFYS